MAAVVSTRMIRLAAVAPRVSTSPIIETVKVLPLTGAAVVGGQTAYNTGVGFFLGYSGGAFKFSIGDPAAAHMLWDGSALTIVGNVTASSGAIGGFELGADYVRDVANSFGLASTVSGGDDVRFWAGSAFADRATAPFRLTEAGVLTAASGSIGGWTLGATALSAVSGGNTTTLSSGATSFAAGPTGAPTVSITQAGVLAATAGVIGGWTIGATTLSGGGVGANGTATLDSAGVIKAVKSTTVAQLFAQDPGTGAEAGLYITYGILKQVDALSVGGSGRMVLYNGSGIATITAYGSTGVLTATSLAGTITTATQNSVTTMTGLTTVGALNAGSITSGFGSIDVGADAISGGAISGTTGAFSGIVTAPAQPAFLAYNSATDANVTGAGTAVTVDFDTEVFDQGSNFAADTFTAPVTGRYRFSSSIYFIDLTTAEAYSLELVTSNRTLRLDTKTTAPFTGEYGLNGSALADMDAGDTAYIRAAVYGMAGDTADIYGTTNPFTYFSGELVC